MTIPALMLLLAIVSPQSAAHQDSIRNAYTDEVLLPACAPDQLAKLKAISYGLAKDRNPDTAWTIAKQMLCGKTAPIRYMPLLVSTEQYGIGDDPGPIFALTPRERIRAQAGVAYGATVEADGRDLYFSYSTAGICVGGFTLRHIASSWLLVKVGEACD